MDIFSEICMWRVCSSLMRGLHCYCCYLQLELIFRSQLKTWCWIKCYKNKINSSFMISSLLRGVDGVVVARLREKKHNRKNKSYFRSNRT